MNNVDIQYIGEGLINLNKKDMLICDCCDSQNDSVEGYVLNGVEMQLCDSCASRMVN